MLIFAPQSNTPGKSDATGAFIPESQAFAKLHGGIARTFANAKPMGDRRSAWLRSLEGLDRKGRVFALYSHGWPRGVQLGFLIGHIDTLASTLAVMLPERPMVVNLACCDAARDQDDDRMDDLNDGVGGIGGFADMLCTRLAAHGVQSKVFAHASTGHTTSNPYVRVFDSQDAYPQGGTWLVSPKDSPKLFLRWRNALRDTDLRHRFCLMTREALIQELENTRIVG